MICSENNYHINAPAGQLRRFQQSYIIHNIIARLHISVSINLWIAVSACLCVYIYYRI